jgi:peptidoglycan/LPS O-acetylase OafA/YrhL
MPAVSATLVACAVTLIAVTLGAGLVGRIGFPLPNPRQRMGQVDGLRGYLAVFVVMHHFTIWQQVPFADGLWMRPTLHAFYNFGSGAVALFFMTTGFVFYPRVLAGFRATNWRATVVSRLFRIVPMVALSLGLILGIILWRQGLHAPASWYTQLKAVVQWLTCYEEPPLLDYADSGRLNAYVLWSLRFEWIFYLAILPAMALLRDLTRSLLPSWALPAGLIVATTVLQFIVPAGRLFTLMPLFGYGMLAYEVSARPHMAAWLRRPIIGIAALELLMAAVVLGEGPYDYPQIIAYVLLFSSVACGNSLLGLLSGRGAGVLGECSFGIYALHGIALDILFVDILPRFSALDSNEALLFMPLAAVLVVVACAVAHLVVERPGIRAGKALLELWSDKAFRAADTSVPVHPAVGEASAPAGDNEPRAA